MFKLETFLDDYDIKYKKIETESKGKPCTKFVLEHCIFDSSHTGKDACFFQYENGNIHYKCFHNSCSEYKWNDAKLEIAGNDNLKKYWLKESVKAKVETPKAKIVTFATLYSEYIKQLFIINQFINVGDLSIIYGPGGLGKSMFAFFLALILASIKLKMPSQKGKVNFLHSPNFLFETFPILQGCTSLFIQTENTRAVISQRMRKMVVDDERYKKGLNRIAIPEINNEVLATGMSFQEQATREFVLDLIKKSEDEMGEKLDIMWIDPLISFHAGDENSNGSMRRALDYILEVASEAGVTPIVIHHEKKGGGMRGASAIQDCCRNLIKLKEKDRKGTSLPSLDESAQFGGIKNYIEVIHEKSNNFRKFSPFVIQMMDNLRFEKVEAGLSPLQQEKCDLAVKAIEKLGGTAPTKTKLINKYMELSGVKQTTAKKDITLAKAQGYICEDKSKSKKGAIAYTIYGKL